MLTLFSKHGLFDLTVAVDGDLDVDGHHSVEDVGICLGLAFHDAIGDARGLIDMLLLIPMDESLCRLQLM